MKTLLRNAYILSMEDNKDIFYGEVAIDDNIIVYAGLKKKWDIKFDQVIDCEKNLLMPAFKNAHTHSAMTFLRSAADDLPLKRWLFEAVFPAEKKLLPSDMYYLSKLAFLEYLTSGISTCFDMYFHPLEFKKAAEEMGMRAVILGMRNEYTSKEQMKEYIQTFKGLVTYLPGFHSEYTVDRPEFDDIAEITNELHVGTYTHLSETSLEVEECKARRNGMTPIEYLTSINLFNYGGACFHCNYLTDHDIEIFKERHIGVVTCPGSNTKLGSGICDVKRLLDNDILVAIGTDGPASNNCLDMFKEMTLVYSLAKVSHLDSSIISPREVLKMATVNGSVILGLDNIKTISENNVADIIMIDLHKPNMRPFNNIEKNIVYAGSKDNVKMTMVNGKILYMNGEFLINEDIDEIYNKCQEITDRILRDK